MSKYITDETKTKFEQVTLRGGPHDGQSMQIPVDEFRVELIDWGRRHVYERFNSRPVLHHKTIIARMVSGGAR